MSNGRSAAALLPRRFCRRHLRQKWSWRIGRHNAYVRCWSRSFYHISKKCVSISQPRKHRRSVAYQMLEASNSLIEARVTAAEC